MALKLPRAFWPITIVTGVNDKIDVNNGSAYAASIAAGTYYTPETFAAAVQTALQAAAAWTWTVSVSSTGRFTISNVTWNYVLQFGNGANAATSARALLGWPAANTASALSQVAPYQHGNGWYADDPVRDDSLDLPEFERAQTSALSGRVRGLEFATRTTRQIELAYLQAWKFQIGSEAAAGKTNEAIERLFRYGWARFRWWPDVADLATWDDYVLDLETAKKLTRKRAAPSVALYDLSLKFRHYV